MRISDWSSDVCSSDLLDGRYAAKGQPLRHTLSEAAFMAHRVEVEVAWLLGLSEAGLPELPPFSGESKSLLKALVKDFSEDRSEERRVGKACVSTCRSRWAPYH